MRLVLVVLVLSLCLSAAGCLVKEELDPLDPDTGRSVSGTISPASAASGATLHLGRWTATTSASGAFRFDGVPAGTYMVTATRTGFSFTPASRRVTISTADVGGIDFTGSPGTASRHTVRGIIRPASAGAGAAITVGTSSAVAGADGTFAVGDVPDGSHTLAVKKSGFTFTPAALTVTVVGADVRGIELSGQPSSTARHRVTGTLRPAALAAGATVALGERTTTANAGGEFSFADVPAGSYTVTPKKSDTIFLPASRAIEVDADVAQLDFAAALPRVITISGAVRPAAGHFVDSDTLDWRAPRRSNDTHELAQPIVSPATVGGHVSRDSDRVDRFRGRFVAGERITLRMADATTSDLDLRLFAAAGPTVYAESAGSSDTETVIVPASGHYVVEVEAYAGACRYVLATHAPGAATARGDIGVVHVQLVDGSGAVIDDVDAVRSDDGTARYVLTSVPPGLYWILAGADIDGNYVQCEAGEPCGWWPSDTTPSSFYVDGTTDLAGFDLPVAVEPFPPR